MNNKLAVHERGRAWRRSQTRVKAKSESNRVSIDKQNIIEKNWKLVYMRSEKLRRAKQLGIEYPRRNIRLKLSEE